MKSKSTSHFVNTLFFRVMISFFLAGIAKDISGVIDTYFISHYMSDTVQAAKGLFFPLQLVIELIGLIFCGGIGTVVASLMGKTKTREAQNLVNTSFSFLLTISVIIVTLMLLFINPLCRITGMNHADPEVIVQLRLYALAYLPGMVIFGLTNLMFTVAQFDGSSRLCSLSLAVMIISNVLGDIVCTMFLHTGAFGIAMASTVSFISGFLVFVPHFFFGDTILKIRFRLEFSDDFKEVLKKGFSFAIAVFSAMAFILVMNYSLGKYGGVTGTAAYSVYSSIRTVVFNPIYSLGLMTPVVVGIFISEEDAKGLKTFYVSMRRYLCYIILGYSLILFFIAPLLVGRFADGEVYSKALQLLRVQVLSFPIEGFIFFTRGFYSSIGRVKASYIFNILADCICPSVCILLFTYFRGFNAIAYSLTASYVLYFLCNVVYLMYCRSKVLKGELKIPSRLDYYGISENATYDASLQSLEDVVKSSVYAYNLCKQNGIDEKKSNAVSLALEEIGADIFLGGSNKKNLESIVRIIIKGRQVTLIVRDNGKLINPTHWTKLVDTDDIMKSAGIKLVLKKSKSVTYYCTARQNELIVKI